MALFYKRSYVRKPERFLSPNLQHPHLNNCVGWWPIIGEHGQNLRDFTSNFISDKNAGSSGLVPTGYTEKGFALKPAGVSTRYVEHPYNTRYDVAAQNHSIFALVRLNSVSGNQVITSMKDGGGQYEGFQLRLSGGAFQAHLNHAADAWINLLSGVAADTWYHIGYTFNAGTNELEVYHDGVNIASLGSIDPPTNPVSSVFRIGLNTYSADNPFNGDIVDLRIYNDVVPSALVRDISQNLWAPFERRIWVPTATGAAGGATVDVPLSTYAIASNVPAIQTSVEVDVPLSTYSISALVPSVEINVAITTPLSTYAISSNVPAVLTGASVIVPLETYAIAASIPAIETGVSVSAPLATYAITANIPVISTGVIVAVPLTTYAIAAGVPTISTGKSVSVPLSTYAITASAPTIPTGASVAVPLSTYAIAANAPLIQFGQVNVPLATYVISYSDFAPTLRVGLSSHAAWLRRLKIMQSNP